jgi:hypothetical protein
VEQLTTKVEPLVRKEQQLNAAASTLKTVEADANGYRDWLAGKYRWVDLLGELRKALIAAEEKARPGPGVDVGVWVESLRMGYISKEFGESQPEEQQQEETKAPVFTMSPELMRRYGLMPPSSTPAAEGEGGEGGSGESSGEAAPASDTPKKKAGSTNEVTEIELVLKAVNLNNLSPTRNLYIAAAVEEELKASAYFNPTNTRLGKQLPPEPDAPTFTFELTLGLKDPIKL